MIGQQPSAAPPRSDLRWLRHRSLRRPAGDGTAASAVADFLTGRATRPGRHPAPSEPTPAQPPAPVRPPAAAPAPAATTSLDLSAPEPATTSSLDLSPPAPPAPAPTTSLDLSAPSPPAPAPSAPAPATSLDLSSPAPPTAPMPAAAPPPRRPTHLRPVPRAASGSRRILTPRDPTVTLNRIQSGIGTLTIEAVCSPAVGDLRIGALYELADGTSSVVSAAAGIPAAPSGSRRPVITGSLGRYDRLVVDLRQSRALRRLLVYAYSESGRELDWGGTLLITTFGGARVELPLDLGRHHGPIALLSLYAVDGEFVLRAENEKVGGAVREAARMFGYDRITWADDSTPVL